MLLDATYRPHNPGHDYYDRGTYLITLVTIGREASLGKLNSDIQHPEVILFPLGTAVLEAWKQTEVMQRAKGRKLTFRAAAIMPDHFHGVITIEEPMDRHLGEIIRSFKMACTQAKHELLGVESCPMGEDIMWQGKKLRNLSIKQRSEYYESLSQDERPLFDPNYDDSIALLDGQEEAMIRYVLDNPRRAVMRKMRPDFFTRVHRISIADHDYAAFGNLFLLKWGWKQSVMCHRWRMIGDKRDYNTPYEQTEDFRIQYSELMDAVGRGAILVTPGISKGEQLIKKECLSSGIPLIHLQKEPIGAYWKPEQMRFAACEQGHLLILAPWSLEEMDAITSVAKDGTTTSIPADTDYSRFHNMNKLAEQIAAFQGTPIIRAKYT